MLCGPMMHSHSFLGVIYGVQRHFGRLCGTLAVNRGASADRDQLRLQYCESAGRIGGRTCEVIDCMCEPIDPFVHPAGSDSQSNGRTTTSGMWLDQESILLSRIIFCIGALESQRYPDLLFARRVVGQQGGRVYRRKPIRVHRRICNSPH